MSDPAITQVEDRLAAVLSAYPALSGFTVMVSESLDIALPDDLVRGLIISTNSYRFEVSDENWNTLHTANIEVEAIHATPNTGTISRANRAALAHVLAAIAADRTLGIGLHDIQEDDIAAVEPRGKDVDSASLQFTAQFFTARGDWFTIL